MATVDLDLENFEQIIADNEIVLVDFWAPWCGPCKVFAPVYEEVSENHPDAVFAKVNTQDHPRLAEAFQIQSIPTLMVFREQVILFAESGTLSSAELENVIQQVREVDMAEVHREAAEQQKE